MNNGDNIPTSVIDDICRDEGFSALPYDCPAGFKTIGHGLRLPLSDKELYAISSLRGYSVVNENLEEINREESRRIVRKRLRVMLKELDALQPIRGHDWQTYLPPEAVHILMNMLFNLGARGLSKFRKMWFALLMHNYRQAAVEMEDSEWYRQVRYRGVRLVKRMREVSHA